MEKHGADSQLAGGFQWQFKYELWLAESIKALEGLHEDPGFMYAEDLGDYSETIHQLLSFAPRARDDIQRLARGATQ
jgi:hypothetical protein